MVVGYLRDADAPEVVGPHGNAKDILRVCVVVGYLQGPKVAGAVGQAIQKTYTG